MPEPRRAAVWHGSAALLLRLPRWPACRARAQGGQGRSRLNGLITGMLAGAVGWQRDGAIEAADSTSLPRSFRRPPEGWLRILPAAIIANIVVVVLAALAAITLLIVALQDGWWFARRRDAPSRAARIARFARSVAAALQPVASVPVRPSSCERRAVSAGKGGRCQDESQRGPRDQLDGEATRPRSWYLRPPGPASGGVQAKDRCGVGARRGRARMLCTGASLIPRLVPPCSLARCAP